MSSGAVFTQSAAAGNGGAWMLSIGGRTAQLTVTQGAEPPGVGY